MDCDYVMTVRELAKYLRDEAIALHLRKTQLRCALDDLRVIQRTKDPKKRWKACSSLTRILRRWEYENLADGIPADDWYIPSFR